MEIIKDIQEDRLWDDPQENPVLVYLKDYINSITLYDTSWTNNRVKVNIDFIRRFTIYEVDGKIGYEIRYDGTSSLGKGKGITRSIPPKRMKSFERYLKLKQIV